MRSPFFALAALSTASLVGCAEPSVDSANADPTSSTATAVVVVERSAGPNEAIRSDAVIARFVRVRQGAVDDPALRLAGIAEDIPAVGTCSAPNDTTPTSQGRSLDLLDVGQVVITSDTAAKQTVLLPRSMPDSSGVVSGVFYSARAAEAFSSGAPVSLRSLGGPDLEGGFAVTATAPREIGDVHVASTASGLDVSWDPIDTDTRDLFYVEMMSPSSRVVVRCTSADASHVLVPSSTLAGLDDSQLAIHRVHKEGFRAKGIDPGEVRFDVSKIVNLRP